MVSEETQTKLKTLSRQAGTTISGLCREILDDHVNHDSTSKSC
jgi:predicted DNA-binding protein